MRTTLKVLGLALVAACATNPVTGRRELSLVSEAQEIEMGRQSLAQAQQQTGFYDNAALTAYVREMGMAMARASERPNLPWEFHVLDDAAINAFAAPGGFIFVTRGILAVMNSGAELAGVLGHEVGHVTAKHSVSQVSKATLAQVGLVAGAIAAPDIAGGAVGQLAQVGAGMLFLKFGRDDERQSDELGHRYSLQRGYDVREMPKTFRTLQRVGEQAGASNRVPAFMSTHPDPGDRVQATQQWADTVTSVANLRTDRDRYLALMDGLVFGADPRAGYFDNNRFLHPVLRFQFDAPVNWQGVNMANQVVLVEPNGQGQIQLSGVQQGSPAAAAQAFSAQQGVTTRQSGALTVHGLPAHGVAFTAQSQDGQQLVGEVLFIAHGGTVYQFLSLTLASTQQHLATMGATLRSFAPTASNQQFRRVRELNVITLGANTTATALAQQSGGAGTAAEIALINGVTEGETLPRGRTVKTVRYR